MPRYLVVRTDRRHATFIAKELAAGRLRQGWAYLPEQDLRAIRERVNAGAKLTDAQSAAWRNRRLLDTERDGVKPGDTIIIPNIPRQGCWSIVRVSGGYRYEAPPADAGGGTDFAHIVPVEPVRAPNGEIAVVEADNEHVHARLRASMRSMSRMWSVDAFGDDIEKLIAAIAHGADTTRPQPEAEKFAALASVAAANLWRDIDHRYKGAELEHLIVRVFERIYDRVEHWGGAGEKGADLIVYTRDPLGLEFKIAVQVKKHDGEHDDVHALDQIRTAREAHRVDAGVVLTTATTLSERFSAHQAKLEVELGIDIRVLTRDPFLRLLLAHLGAPT